MNNDMLLSVAPDDRRFGGARLLWARRRKSLRSAAGIKEEIPRRDIYIYIERERGRGRGREEEDKLKVCREVC